jgi:pimeloyl-ACP methyl ester carboxylesterase
MQALRDPSSPPTPDFVLDDIVEQSAIGPIGRMMGDLEGFESHLLEGRLHEIATPVDLLWGGADQLISLDYASRMAEQLPRSRLEVIENCGHIPANECPQAFLAKLEEVLAAPPPEPRPASEMSFSAEEVDATP